MHVTLQTLPSLIAKLSQWSPAAETEVAGAHTCRAFTLSTMQQSEPTSTPLSRTTYPPPWNISKSPHFDKVPTLLAETSWSRTKFGLIAGCFGVFSSGVGSYQGPG